MKKFENYQKAKRSVRSAPRDIFATAIEPLVKSEQATTLLDNENVKFVQKALLRTKLNSYSASNAQKDIFAQMQRYPTQSLAKLGLFSQK